MISAGILEEAAALLAACRARGWMLATAESCTGGLITAGLTAIAGSTDVVDCGFVAYSNEAKMGMLGVPGALIGEYGAVSDPVARAMAEGALTRSRATIAIAASGFAGPGGGSVDKPVGLVWFALAERGAAARSERVIFPGDRQAIREATVSHAFALIRARM
jgi:nicotinamide-nucleotide amidase